MRHRTSEYLVEPISRAKDQVKALVRKSPVRSIGGVLGLALVVAIGIWAWPELHCTIHIHRM